MCCNSNHHIAKTQNEYLSSEENKCDHYDHNDNNTSKTLRYNMINPKTFKEQTTTMGTESYIK